MQTIRVLATREKNASQQTVAVAVCLEHFVVGQGANDAAALESLLFAIRGLDTIEGMESFESHPPAPEEYQKKFANSTRESNVARGDFSIQVRSG